MPPREILELIKICSRAVIYINLWNPYYFIRKKINAFFCLQILTETIQEIIKPDLADNKW